MNRRQYLALSAGGLAALAGCSGSFLESAEYEAGNKEALLPDSVGEDWPDQDLEADHDVNENFDRVWVAPDNSLAVLMDVEISEAIEGAKDSFQKSKATASNPNDYPMADEAIVYDDGQMASCVFRDSNAIGMAVSTRRSGGEFQPDRTRATTYAELMYQDWPNE